MSTGPKHKITSWCMLAAIVTAVFGLILIGILIAQSRWASDDTQSAII